MTTRRKSIFDIFKSTSTVEDSIPEKNASESGGADIGSRNNAGATAYQPTSYGAPRVSGVDVLEVFENERCRDLIGWSPKNLEVDDPKNFSWAAGSADSFITPPPPEGYEFQGIWELDKSYSQSDEGWLYARNFRQFIRGEDCAAEYNNSHRVRRKRWVRDIKLKEGHNLKSAIEDDININDEEPTEDASDRYLFLKVGGGGGSSRFTEADDDVSSSVAGGELAANQVLLGIGRQLREVEAECAREAEKNSKDFKKHQYPQYKMQSKEMEKSLATLEAKLKKLTKASEQEVLALEEVINAHRDALDATKKRLLFPDSVHTLGGNGVYFAIDDVWLERVSGVFVADLIGSLTSPQIIVVLTGVESGPNSGTTIKVKLQGFKLNATGAPALSLNETVVTACVRASLLTSFNVPTNSWKISSNNFKIELLKFSGPYGLTRPIVSTILGMVSSLIRKAIIDALPQEIGHFLRTLPIPFGVRGEFELLGTPLSHLSKPLHESPELCHSLGYDIEHMKLFNNLQRGLGR